MNERLTDAELDGITGRLQRLAGVGWVDGAQPRGWASRDEIEALVAEAQERRAARTLSDDEQADVDRASVQFAGLSPQHPGRRLLAIIDRITEDQP